MVTIPAEEVVRVLRAKNATEVFHANTAMTSYSFMRQAGLLSREAVEKQELLQTDQCTDAKDKKFGVWDKVFVDALDIHDRLRRRNLYGPVMFVFDLDVLLSPHIFGIGVTKFNPIHWAEGNKPEQRWYSADEFAKRFVPRESYNSSLVLKCVGGRLPFSKHLKRIVVDDPKQQLPGTAFTAFEFAKMQVGTGAVVDIVARTCPKWCGCPNEYKTLVEKSLDVFHKMFDAYGTRGNNPLLKMKK